MAIKLAETSTQELLHNCKKHRIRVDHRVVAERRDHGYDFRLKPHETAIVARIWYLWTPGDEICWVEFLIIDAITYIEDKPSRRPQDVSTEPED